MKKALFVLFTIFTIVSILCISCSKDSNLTPNDKNPIKTLRATNDYPTTWNGVDACQTPPSNCMAEVVITTPKPNAFVAFEDAVDGDAGDIGDYFNSSGWEDIFPNIDPTDLQNLRSGNYDMLRVNNGNISYFLAGEAASLSVDNVDFVLVVEIQ